MIVDASSIIAILRKEPDAYAHAEAIEAADRVFMAAPTRVELAIASSRHGLLGVDELIHAGRIELVDFTAAHAAVACSAHDRYGRGSGSPAKLNFGDCMVYAVATVMDQPLLFKGMDFTHTDVTPAITPR